MLIPKKKNLLHFKLSSDVIGIKKDAVLMKVGLFTALAIGIHNFPEGLAALGTTLNNVKLGGDDCISTHRHS